MALGLSAQAKYVFFFIGDGMGMGHVNAAEYYNRLVLGNDQPLLMMQFPVASYALTYSASSKITDSAAAGTALSTGNKTKNGMIAMNPDTMEVVSIARKLKDEGWGVGILSSNAPTMLLRHLFMLMCQIVRCMLISTVRLPPQDMIFLEGPRCAD